MEFVMPQTLNTKDEANERLPPPADETSDGDQGRHEETGAAVKRIRMPDDAAEDASISPNEGLDLNPS